MSSIKRRIERLEKQLGFKQKPPSLLTIDFGDEVMEIYEDEFDQLLQEIDEKSSVRPSEQELIQAKRSHEPISQRITKSNQTK